MTLQGYASEILHHPRLLVYAVSHPNLSEIRKEYWRRERSWLPTMFGELDSVTGIGEMESKEFLAFLDQKTRVWGLKHRCGSYYAALFLCSRWTRAKNIIETGVGYGYSSYTLLASSPDVNVISIDFPNKEYFEPTRYGKMRHGIIETGVAVPSEFRDRWELIIGDAKTELPKVVDRSREIDIFLHDSEHTREHMLFEYETALPLIRKGGMLISDDVELNTAFNDFCNKHDLRFTILGLEEKESDVGVAVKV